MDAGCPRLFQFPKIRLPEQAEGDADLNPRLPPHRADALADLFHLRLRKPPAACDDGVAQHPLRRVALRLRHDFFRGKQRVRLPAGCGIMGALGTVFAVLRTLPALSVYNCTQIEAAPAKMRPNLIRRLTELLKRRLPQRHDLLFGKQLTPI